MTYKSSSKSLDELGATNLKNSVEMTISFIDSLNKEVEKGTLTLEEAQEKVKVAVIGEKKADGKREINPNLNLGENGYVFILDPNGIQVADPYAEGENLWDLKDLSGEKVVQKMIETGNDGGGYTYYDWYLPDSKETDKKITYSKTDPNWGWTVNGSTYMTDFNQPATHLLQLVLLIIGITLLAGTFIVWIFANSIAKPVNKVSKQMGYLANGDLTHDPLEIKSQDEIGNLARAMNEMQSQLKEIIYSVSVATETITSQSEEFSQSANEVKEGGEQIAGTMQELATAAEMQADSATTLNEKMDELNGRIFEANQHGKSVEIASASVLKMAEDGSGLMDKSVDQMENIHHKVNVAVKNVRDLNEETRKISKLVSVIEDIAAQTNLLSLNAAIEAARAGEHGKGFAVVASEVRKLAEQVTSSVGEITTIVNHILQNADRTVDSLESSYVEVENGTKQIETTGRTFGEITQSVSDMVQKIQGISENLKELTNKSGEMSKAIEDVAAVSEEAAAGVEQTAASAEQSSSSMEEIANGAVELATLAESLNNQVRKFRL
nr:methyl-accepting chemotaxis protein [Bacillus niameyensis]